MVEEITLIDMNRIEEKYAGDRQIRALLDYYRGRDADISELKYKLERSQSDWADAKLDKCDAENYSCKLQSQLADFLKFAHAHEDWEADLILNGDWYGDNVTLTDHQYEQAMQLQAMRNQIISKTKANP